MATTSDLDQTTAQLDNQVIASNPELQTERKRENDAVFSDLNLASHSVLQNSLRTKCPGKCGKKRRYFCSECSLPLVSDTQSFPKVVLPLHVDILQSGAEVPQRSTAQHVPILAPGFSTVWRPFPECLDQFNEKVLKHAQVSTIAVLYPTKDAINVDQVHEKLPNLKRLVVIDSTWTKSVVLMQQSCLQQLPKISLPAGRPTRFWRYAPKRSEHSEYFSPDKVESLVSTVESVHRFCEAYGKTLGYQQGYSDNLLWLFAFLHGRVKEVYQENPGKRQRIMRKSKGLLNQF